MNICISSHCCPYLQCTLLLLSTAKDPATCKYWSPTPQLFFLSVLTMAYHVFCVLDNLVRTLGLITVPSESA